MSESPFKQNQTLLRLKQLQRQIKFMNAYFAEEMSKPIRKRFIAYMEVIKQEASEVEKALQEHGGTIK